MMGILVYIYVIIQLKLVCFFLVVRIGCLEIYNIFKYIYYRGKIDQRQGIDYYKNYYVK